MIGTMWLLLTTTLLVYTGIHLVIYRIARLILDTPDNLLFFKYYLEHIEYKDICN
jgi:hypothetical protein